MNPTNPKINEIRDWAYSAEEWPHEEWDLFLSWTREIDLFIELAIDHQCPKRVFFLHVLYFLVSATFNEPTKTDKIDRIKCYIQKGLGISHGDIKAWIAKVQALLKGKVKYNYDDWRGGVLAGYKFK